MPCPPRRRFLRLSGTALTAALAGCPSSTDPTATDSESATPTATPTDGATQTPTDSPDGVAAAVWSVDRLTGRVDTLLLPDVGPAESPAGPLYAATAAGEVARIDPVAGRHGWTTTVHGDSGGDPDVAPVGDAVYAVSETFTDDRLATDVEALEPATGDVRWRFGDRAFLRVHGVVDDLVVLAGEYITDDPEEIGPNRSPRGEGRLYGIDRATGRQRWRVTVPDLRGADVADHGIYALEDNDQETHQLALLAFDPDGTERWRVDTGTINPGAPLAADGLLLAGAGEGTDRGGVARYDPTDGSLMWTAGDWDRGPTDLALRDGVVHAGTLPFLVLDPDGSERYRVGRFGGSDLAGTPETLYDDGGSTVAAVDRAAGTVRWRYRPEDYDYTHLRAVLGDSVAVDRGIGEDREFVVLAEPDGSVVGAVETPAPYWGAVGAGRRLFLGVGSDVVAYDR